MYNRKGDSEYSSVKPGLHTDKHFGDSFTYPKKRNLLPIAAIFFLAFDLGTTTSSSLWNIFFRETDNVH